MANAFEIRDQCAQPRSDKTRAEHRFIDRGEVRFLAARAIASQAAMLADLDGARDDFDLLHDPRRFVAGFDVSAAIGADGQLVVPRRVDLIGRKRRSLVPGMAWLGSLLAFSFGGRLWRFDNIAGRRFG